MTLTDVDFQTANPVMHPHVDDIDVRENCALTRPDSADNLRRSPRLSHPCPAGSHPYSFPQLGMCHAASSVAIEEPDRRVIRECADDRLSTIPRDSLKEIGSRRA